MEILRLFFAGSILLISCILPAHADIGLPMLAIVWPVFWVGLIPIIFIEWRVLRRCLLGLSSKRLFYVASLSNVLSTLIGLPLAWICLVLIQMNSPGGGGTYPSLNNFWRFFFGVTIQSPWLVPYEDQLYWMVPTAFIFLLIPFFFMSYWLEAFVTIKFLRKSSTAPSDIKKAVWKANIQSYAFLCLLGILFLFFCIITH